MINTNFQQPTKLGYGAYGTVYTYKKDQAVKITLMDSFDKLQSTLREIHSLRQLSIVPVDSYVTLNRVQYMKKYKKMHIFLNRMDGNLRCIDFKDVSAKTIENYCVQLFEGLFAMRKHRLFHRDIKPENILVNFKGTKLFYCDFGLSRQFHDNEVEYGTGYIVTRWYRAPELMEHQQKHMRKANLHYTEKMDVWSVGAMIYEMIFKKPLAAGKDLADALKLIDRHVNPLNERNGKRWKYDTLIKHEKITERVAKCLLGSLKIDPKTRYGCTRCLHALGSMSAEDVFTYQESGVESTVLYAPTQPYSFHYYDIDVWKERSKKFAELYKRFPSQKSVIAYAIVVYDNTDILSSTTWHFANSVNYSALVLGSYYNSEVCNKLIKYACTQYGTHLRKEDIYDEICDFTQHVTTKKSSLWEKGDEKSFTTFLKKVLEPPKEENKNKRIKIK